MEIERVSFLSDTYRLEGRLAFTQGHTSASGIVICHPHPQYGGSMDNNVVHALFEGFSSRGYVALAFNFRGVGMSEGAYGDGTGEHTDVIAALNFLERLPQVKGQGLGLSGYSFGAWVGLKACVEDLRVKCVGMVSPPIGMLAFDFLEGYETPVIIVSGDEDQFCMSKDVEQLLQLPSGPKEWKVITGADHFYFTKAREASEYICQRFVHYLPPGNIRIQT